MRVVEVGGEVLRLWDLLGVRVRVRVMVKVRVMVECHCGYS